MAILEISLLYILNFTIFQYIVYLIFVYYFYRAIRFIYSNFFRKKLNFKLTYGENSWALITGATDGLGKEYAIQLGKEGFNLILVSRSEAKLHKVATEIKPLIRSDLHIHTIPFDFSLKTTPNDYLETFGKITEKYDVSILVNNVGTNVEGRFTKLSIEEHFRFINVNVAPQTILTKIFCDYLSKRKFRSAVVDLSSFLSFYPVPGVAMYCATKSFNFYLTRALAEEFANYNIDFLCVKPLFADTPLSKMKANGIITITSEQSVTGALNDLGFEKETYGHWIHKIQAFLIGFIPKWLIYPAFRFISKKRARNLEIGNKVKYQ